MELELFITLEMHYINGRSIAMYKYVSTPVLLKKVEKKVEITFHSDSGGRNERFPVFYHMF